MSEKRALMLSEGEIEIYCQIEDFWKVFIHGNLLIPGAATPIKTYKSINKTFE